MKRSLESCKETYGEIQGSIWTDEIKWCVSYPIPALIQMKNSQGTVQKHVYCNKEMMAALDRAFQSVIENGLTSELKTFDGCFMIRDVRGEPGKPSAHSYALAIDLNAATNQLGTDGDLSDELAKCFTDAGFTWGKTFQRKDPMHFSYCWE